jgi:peptide-methionine (S)-S-oxide reductase
MIKIGVGGGCHWCTEAVFQALKGVALVEQGFIASTAPNDGYSEAVIVSFDPEQVSLKDLVSAHLITHASGSDHKMRGKYRSAVYVFDDEQKMVVEAILAELSDETGNHFVTQVLLHQSFKPSDERFHNYYKTQPERPFCKTYINPKFAKLRQHMAGLLKTEAAT